MNQEAQESSRFLRRIIFVTCVVISCYGYVTGWPLWFVLLLMLITPAVSLGVSCWSGRFRRYRFLFVIYTLAVLIGGFEAWQHRTIPESLTDSLNLPTGPGDPDLFMDYDLASVLLELYPERSEVLFIRGYQIKLCNDYRGSHLRYRVCEQFPDTNLASVREYFERALRMKSKTDENLYYHYVEILIRMNASQSEIDAASAEWKRIFPLSERQDPREVFTLAAQSR